MKPANLSRCVIRMKTCAIVFIAAFFTLNPASAGERFSVSMPGWIGSLNFSPDGKRLAVSCADASARVLEAETGKETAVLRGHEDYVSSVAFAPDGRTLATAGYHHPARLWDIRSGHPPHVLRGHRGAAVALAVRPGGKRAATRCLSRPGQFGVAA